MTKVAQLIVWLKHEAKKERILQQSILHLFPWEVDELLQEVEELAREAAQEKR